MSLPDMMEWAKEHPDRAAIRIAELKRENAALRSDLNKCNNLSEIRRDAFYDEKSGRWAMVDRVRELERENAALRADKYRLDWLDEHCELVVLTNSDGSDLFMHNAFLNPDKAGKLRSVIDAYRKEAQS